MGAWTRKPSLGPFSEGNEKDTLSQRLKDIRSVLQLIGTQVLLHVTIHKISSGEKSHSHGD